MDDKIVKAAEKIIAEYSRIPRDVTDAIQFLTKRHSYSARLDAHHLVRSSIGFGEPVCSKTDLFVLSGTDVTDTTGRVTLPIQSLLCGATEGLEESYPRVELVIVRAPNFVATPHGSAPIFLTASTHSTPRELPSIASTALVNRDGNPISGRKFLGDVSVEVMAWLHDGSPAERTSFSWMCTIEAGRSIYLGG